MYNEHNTYKCNNTWSRAYIVSVRVPLDDSFAALAFQKPSGSSDFKGMLHLETLRVDATGSSDIYLQGHAAAARIRLSGSSDVKSFDFDADVVDIDASGSSDVNITANKELRVKASGSSDVIYKGNALVTRVNTSGSSELSKKN